MRKRGLAIATTIEERIAEATRTATPTTFGIELEMTGISRKRVSELVYNYLQSQEEIENYCMDTFKIIDQKKPAWTGRYLRVL